MISTKSNTIDVNNKFDLYCDKIYSYTESIYIIPENQIDDLFSLYSSNIELDDKCNL